MGVKFVGRGKKREGADWLRRDLIRQVRGSLQQIEFAPTAPASGVRDAKRIIRGCEQSFAARVDDAVAKARQHAMPAHHAYS